MASSSMTSCNLLVLVCVLVVGCFWQSCYGSGTFGFDIHHRFSDAVKGILPVHDLPEKGSVGYYATMVHRDRILHSRRLASTVNDSDLTFVHGNVTVRLSSLGFLHYANVSVGTPSLSFLVALDTGSDLFWLPCDCDSTNCVHSLQTRSGDKIPLNIYSPNASSTSTTIPCNSTLCVSRRQCSATPETCPYKVSYLSANTSTTGILVEDVLHLITDDDQFEAVDAPITIGCGQVQTGSFLKSGAPNGLFGLGIEDVSVPSILAAKGLASNSFSMCFGYEGIGRITFGDKGSSDQRETPFDIRQLHPSYNVSINQITVGKKTTDVNATAIFDTGTSFTYLNDPAYTVLTESFNSQVEEKRSHYNLSIPFEYCYDFSSTQETLGYPSVNLTMAGGDIFKVIDPIVAFSLTSGQYIYCLGILKSGDIDIIGQNFMTGYRIAFDREKMVLGWKESKDSNCYGEETNTLPISPNSTVTPPTVAPTAPVTPQATEGPTSGLNKSETPPPPPPNDSARLSHFSYAFMMILFPFLAIF